MPPTTSPWTWKRLLGLRSIPATKSGKNAPKRLYGRRTSLRQEGALKLSHKQTHPLRGAEGHFTPTTCRRFRPAEQGTGDCRKGQTRPSHGLGTPPCATLRQILDGASSIDCRCSLSLRGHPDRHATTRDWMDKHDTIRDAAINRACRWTMLPSH